jgi:hypothetical protein
MNVKLLKALCTAVAVGLRNALSILEKVYIDKEYLYLSNLETSVRIRHSFRFDPVNNEPVLINTKQFISRLQWIKSPWYISSALDKSISFISPSGDTVFPWDNPIDFCGSLVKLLPGINDRFLCNITAEDIHYMDIAKDFVADDELRPIMQKIVIDGDHIVASDAHKLYFRKIAKKHDDQIMFTRQAIMVLKLFPHQDYKLYTVGKDYCLTNDNITLWWRIEGASKHETFEYYCPGKAYVNWKLVVPHEFTGNLIIPINELLLALKSVKYAANSASGMIKFTLGKDKMKVSGKDLDFGISAAEALDVISLSMSEAVMEFGMNYDFIVQVLNMYKKEGLTQVEMKYISNRQAFVIGDSMLIMPMIINE